MSRGWRALAEEATAALRDNDAGGWTKPSAHQYPHQWNWDSALVSIGWAWIDWERAVTEITSLLEAQWDEGMIPHIRYDPGHLDDYFPGPDRWPNAARHHGAGVLTSGISAQQRLTASALLHEEARAIVGDHRPSVQAKNLQRG